MERNTFLNSWEFIAARYKTIYLYTEGTSFHLPTSLKRRLSKCALNFLSFKQRGSSKQCSLDEKSGTTCPFRIHPFCCLNHGDFGNAPWRSLPNICNFSTVFTMTDRQTQLCNTWYQYWVQYQRGSWVGFSNISIKKLHSEVASGGMTKPGTSRCGVLPSVNYFIFGILCHHDNNVTTLKFPRKDGNFYSEHQIKFTEGRIVAARSYEENIVYILPFTA